MSNNIIPFPGSAAPSGGPNSSQGASTGNPSSDPDPSWLARRVWNIRYDKTFNQDQKARIIYNFIWAYESSKTRVGCAWLRVGPSATPYLYEYNGQRGPRLLEVDGKNRAFTAYLFDTYGLSHGEPVTRNLIDMLQNGAVSKGLHRDVRRFSYWDKREQTLYVSTYDGYCYQITGAPLDQNGVTAVPNGTGSAMFLDDDRGSTPSDPMLGNNRMLFKSLIDDLQYVPSSAGGMSPEIQRTCLGIWMFALAFPDLMPTKPILLVEGERGSGKTLALQRIALALHGKHMPIQVPKQEDKDFGVKILRSPITILDDVNEPVDWLRDCLCTYATGGGWTRRALFTNDAEHVIKPESYLTITTNNPTTFRQSQVADRCLIIRLERREERDGYLGADALFTQVIADRDEIFGEWLTWLNEIVAELRKHPRPRPTKSRMADFAHLAHVIGRVLSRPGGPAGNWSEEAIDEMLDCMQHERNALVIEGDPLIDLIDKWLDTTSNQGREVRAVDLHRELQTLARVGGQTNFFRSPKALASRLREASAALREHFEITRRQGHANTTLYAFRRSTS